MVGAVDPIVCSTSLAVRKHDPHVRALEEIAAETHHREVFGGYRSGENVIGLHVHDAEVVASLTSGETCAPEDRDDPSARREADTPRKNEVRFALHAKDEAPLAFEKYLTLLWKEQ